MAVAFVIPMATSTKAKATMRTTRSSIMKKLMMS